MEILHTKDYSMFNFITGNRPVNKKKIKDLKDEATNGLDLFEYCPIVVYKEDGKYKVIDGQHRFQASKELKKPIYYVVCDKLTLVQIAKLNSNSSNWSNKNFLECFIKTGIEDYKDLERLIKKYHVSYSVASDILMTGNCKYKGATLKKFREGLFKSKYYDFACILLDEVEEVFGRYEFWNHGYLIEAYRQIKEAAKFDKETLKLKIKQAPNILDKRLSVKEYLFNIERVYNNRNNTRVSIF